MKQGDIVELKIEKLTYGGQGLARFNGQVVFVPFAAPQDILNVKITEVKKKFSIGSIENIIHKSPSRVSPPCQIFGQCGGCNWQHLNYQEQLRAKEEILNEICERQLKLQSHQLEPIVPSPKPWNYRNRIQVKSQNGNHGFYARQSHEIVNLTECKITDEPINQAFKTWISKQKPSENLQIHNFKLDLQNKVHITSLQTDEEPIGFSQVNTLQNENLISKVLKTFSQYPQKKVLDLYGGPANFALPLLQNQTKVEGECVEANYKAYNEGLRQKKELALHRLKMINAEVEVYLRRLQSLQDTFVIIDPPRSGCSAETIHHLLNLKPPVIVYISCDPMTWARDCNLLKSLYRTAGVQAFDMFPQTDHIEVFSIWTLI